jgi:hypothetical protein
MHRAPVRAEDAARLDAAFGHVANRVANVRAVDVPERTSAQVSTA